MTQTRFQHHSLSVKDYSVQTGEKEVIACMRASSYCLLWRSCFKIIRNGGAITECRATSDYLFYMCQNLLRNTAYLVTSLRETGEKILLPYLIRQPARSREFAFALTARTNVDSFQNYFCLALYHDWNWNCALNRRSVDLDSWEVSFSSTVNLFYT